MSDIITWASFADNWERYERGDYLKDGVLLELNYLVEQGDQQAIEFARGLGAGFFDDTSPEKPDTDTSPETPSARQDRIAVLSNHTGYKHKGSENFEHDDTGSQMNRSGVEDDFNNAAAVHEAWEPGYDY